MIRDCKFTGLTKLASGKWLVASGFLANLANLASGKWLVASGGLAKLANLASGKWLVASGGLAKLVYSYIGFYGNFQKFNCMARSYESYRNGIFGNKGISEGRNLWLDGPNSQSRSVCSEQHSGRERQKEQQRLCSFSINSQRLVEGIGNSNTNIGKNRIFEQNKVRGNNKAIQLSRSFTNSIKKIARKITTSHSPLATSKSPLATSHFPLATSHPGFGLIEVLAAAVVLGFLIVGLTQLQKGNREGVIRVRARDAADFVAQHVLDSIAAVGVKALDDNCENSPDNLLPEQHDKYIYYFEGKPQLDKKSAGIKAETQYTVKVRCIGEDIVSEDKSDFITANSTISRSIEAEVTWKFKGIDQSIRMSKVVR